ncbi:hypothetical protein [Paenibacillus sp. Soil750]|uniref:hypothetical protein n=1 Tax=Paenibacillus sp. Soil750 TaxID=1736398 RepID=UPI00070123AC|nr:hypothetical protein [Paenibacillus sp. Soil750]KRE70427.1 hypothetical protein ASL11_11990 [Paenibacillus sp. Soil750]
MKIIACPATRKITLQQRLTQLQNKFIVFLADNRGRDLVNQNGLIREVNESSLVVQAENGRLIRHNFSDIGKYDFPDLVPNRELNFLAFIKTKNQGEFNGPLVRIGTDFIEITGVDNSGEQPIDLTLIIPRREIIRIECEREGGE